MSSQLDVAAAAAAAAGDMSRPKAVVPDTSVHQNARVRTDVSRVSRSELEDRFLRLYEESFLFKQHIQTQEDKIKQLGTKLVKLVKDRGRMEQLAAGGAQPVPGVRNVEMEMVMEELQEKVRGLQTENEGLKQRLLVAKQQLMNSQNSRPRPYKHIPPRVNSGLKRRDDSSPVSHVRPGLEETRSKNRNLENVIESQRRHIEEMEVEFEQLQVELRSKEAEYEDRLQQVQQINKLRSHVNDNVTQIKLHKLLTDKSNAVTELEAELQEHKQTLKAAVQKLDHLSEQLRQEKQKCRDLETQLQVSSSRLELLPQQLSEVEQERDQLKESYNKLMDSIFDTSQQQRWQVQEQQLKLQILQLETALKADLHDKNQILQRLKAERENHDKLVEENKNLQLQLLEQREENRSLIGRLQSNTKVHEHRTERSDLSFLEQEEGGGRSTSTDSCVQELEAAHAETILELEKARHLLITESKISQDYKVELEAMQQKMDSDRVSYRQKMDHQTQLLHTSNAKIMKLQAQLKEKVYYSPIFRADLTGEHGGEDLDQPLGLESGEALLELQLVSASLSPALLHTLGDSEPYTFCTYSFYLFKLHSTPVVMGRRPQYGYTSKYVTSMNQDFRDYLRTDVLTVELHQALGTDWRTLGAGQIPLQQLLEQNTKVQGTMELEGSEFGSVGTVTYWLKLSRDSSDVIRSAPDSSDVIRSTLNTSDVIRSAPDSSDVIRSAPDSSDVIRSTLNTSDVIRSTLNTSDVIRSAPDSSDVISCRLSPDPHGLSPAPKPRPESQPKDGPGTKKVTFVNSAAEDELAAGSRLTPPSLPPLKKVEKETVWTPAAVKTGEKDQDEDKSIFSVGQLVPGSQSDSDGSEEVSEEAAGESAQSDSDDIIIHSQATGRKPSERIMVEVVSLSLRPESRVARDPSVVRLFVEYSFLDLPTEETPLSLPKPTLGRGINFNYSKVIPVDAENNAARRQLLKTVLQGQRPHMEEIRFTVVSEPPEEEEQDRECEDVGVAFLKIPSILERQEDLTDTSLDVVDVLDSSEVVGSLTVSVEGLEALQAIMDDQDLTT